jgi:hypothetical protein
VEETKFEEGYITAGYFNNPAVGLLTGSAFPQGGAIINSHLPCRKKPEALQNAHLLCCAANRTAGRLSIYASRFGFLRA